MSRQNLVGDQPTNADLLSAIQQTNQRLDLTNQHLDRTNQSLGTHIQKSDTTHAELLLSIRQTNQRLEQHITQSDETHTDILLAIQGFANATEQRFQSNDKNFRSIDEHFQRIDNEIAIIKSTMATKDELHSLEQSLRDEFNEKYNDLITGQDQILTIVKRLDEERVATIAWLQHHDGQIVTHDLAIKDIQFQLAP